MEEPYTLRDPNKKKRNFDQAFIRMYAMGVTENPRFSGLRFCGGAESVDAADAQLRERRTYAGFRSSTSKRWIPALRRMSYRGEPMRVEGDMAVILNGFFARFACDQLLIISTMSPSCARCAPTGSNASVVH
jgi:hypothetical protein